MKQADSWYSTTLGDGLWVSPLFAQIEETFHSLFYEAGDPRCWALFSRKQFVISDLPIETPLHPMSGNFK
jgi:hypothetical protein